MKNACIAIVCLFALTSVGVGFGPFKSEKGTFVLPRSLDDLHLEDIYRHEGDHTPWSEMGGELVTGKSGYGFKQIHFNDEMLPQKRTLVDEGMLPLPWINLPVGEDADCMLSVADFALIDWDVLDAEEDGSVSAAMGPEVMEENALWWWTVFLGRGYVINGGNIVMRASPLIMSHLGLHAWGGAQAAMGLLYVASMYAKFIEKVELGDPNVIGGIKGKAHIDIGKTAGFYLDMMMITLDYVRKLRLERLGAVVIKEGEQMASDQWGDVLSDLLVGASWVAQLNSVAMNTASLTTKFYKVAELDEKGNATEAEMQRAWRDVYVYIAKLGGGLVGLGAKIAYTCTGDENRSMRYSAMLLSVLGSSLFLYWDMGGLFSEVS